MRTSAAVLAAGLLLLSGPTAVAIGHADAAPDGSRSGGEQSQPWSSVLGIAILLLFAGAGMILGWRWALRDLRHRIYRSRLVVFEVVGYRRAARPDRRPAIATGSHVGPKGGA